MSVFLITIGFIGIIDHILLLFFGQAIITTKFSYVLLFCSIAMFIMGVIFLFIVPREYGFFDMPHHFKIYESGITTKVFHLTPFSKCDKLDYENALLISWNQILGFEDYKFEDRIVYLYIKDNRGKKGYKKINYTFPSNSLKSIKILKNLCLKNKVK